VICRSVDEPVRCCSGAVVHPVTRMATTRPATASRTAGPLAHLDTGQSLEHLDADDISMRHSLFHGERVVENLGPPQHRAVRSAKSIDGVPRYTRTIHSIRRHAMNASPHPFTTHDIVALLISAMDAIRGEYARVPRRVHTFRPGPNEWCNLEVLGHLIEAE